MNEKEFHVLIITRCKDGSSAVYNFNRFAESRLAIFNYFLQRFGDEQPVCTGILSTYYHTYGARESNFVCTDGRKFNNLTNFYLKEE